MIIKNKYRYFILITILISIVYATNDENDTKYYFVQSIETEYDSIAVSSDGRYMLAVINNNISFIDISLNKTQWNYYIENMARFSISPNGDFISLRNENSVELLDKNGNVLWTNKLPLTIPQFEDTYIWGGYC